MKHMAVTMLTLFIVQLVGAVAKAQTQPGNPLDIVPEKMPWATPYGPPISLHQAQSVIQAAVNEATKHGWPENVAVVDSGGNLVAFVRMDGAQLASISIAEHKARTAVRYRRPTRAFEDGVQRSGYNYQLSLDDVIASRGGIPLTGDGKIIGGVGCSGAAGSQDEVLCTAAAATVK
jgi:glc operon protein GlcG